jgi:hypothetical protein
LIYFEGRFFRDDAAAADFPVKIKGSTNDVIARCEAPWQSPRMGVPIGDADIQDPSTQNRPVHLHRSVGLIGNYTIAAVMMAIL